MLQVWALGMLLGAACGTDTEAVTIAANERDEVAAVSELGISRHETLIRVLWVSAQRQHVGDTLPLHPVKDLARPARRVRAREMRHRLDVILALDPCHQLQRLVAGAQAVRDRRS